MEQLLKKVYLLVKQKNWENDNQNELFMKILIKLLQLSGSKLVKIVEEVQRN
jgi:hypothetical protein